MLDHPYNMTMTTNRTIGAILIAALLFAVGCSGGDDSTTASEAPTSETSAEETASGDAQAEPRGIRLVSPKDGAEIQATATDDLIVLDVRTPEEFAEGHLEGAVMIDFYSDDFTDQLGELDPDASYLLYCRSGNRSGQTTTIMEQLGFTDVADIDGGIVSWTEAGLPVVT